MARQPFEAGGGIGIERCQARFEPGETFSQGRVPIEPGTEPFEGGLECRRRPPEGLGQREKRQRLVCFLPRR